VSKKKARWGTPKCQKKKRCLLIWHKRPIDIGQQRPIHGSKETDSQGKRGLFRLAYLRGGRREDGKAAAHMAKEAYVMAKETYHIAKKTYEYIPEGRQT